MQPVTVAVLQIRELKNKQVTSFPKVTLTASEEVGERAQHILRAVISALGGRAQGHGASLSIVWVIGFFLAGWLYVCTVICIRYPMHGCFPCYC